MNSSPPLLRYVTQKKSSLLPIPLKTSQYTREAAVRNHEEKALAMKGHTIHFDGYLDQARDKIHTKFLLPKDTTLGPELNTMDRDEGLNEIASDYDQYHGRS